MALACSCISAGAASRAGAREGACARMGAEEVRMQPRLCSGARIPGYDEPRGIGALQWGMAQTCAAVRALGRLRALRDAVPVAYTNVMLVPADARVAQPGMTLTMAVFYLDRAGGLRLAGLHYDLPRAAGLKVRQALLARYGEPAEREVGKDIFGIGGERQLVSIEKWVGKWTEITLIVPEMGAASLHYAATLAELEAMNETYGLLPQHRFSHDEKW